MKRISTQSPFHLTGAVLLLLHLAPVLGRCADADLHSHVDRIIQPLIREKKTVGVAVGTLTENERYVFGYGRVSLDSRKQPDGNTVFEIGSITKVFTALLLTDMVGKGAVKLDDPVRLYLPASAKVPTSGSREITLLDLATHTSSLPRMPSNFHQSQNKSPANPYKYYSQELMFDFLSHHKLRRDIGAKYEYSNFAFGLLGVALARKATTDYEQLAIRRMCNPLNMKDTRITLSRDQRSRLAAAHTAGLQPTSGWDFDTFAGAGALRSSVNDMLVFLAANLGRTKTDLVPAMTMCHKPRVSTANKRTRVGLGWHVTHLRNLDEDVIWHNGETGGYHSYLGFIRETGTGVVVLSNSRASIDAQAVEILQALNTRPKQRD